MKFVWRHRVEYPGGLLYFVLLGAYIPDVGSCVIQRLTIAGAVQWQFLISISVG